MGKTGGRRLQRDGKARFLISGHLGANFRFVFNQSGIPNWQSGRDRGWANVNGESPVFVAPDFLRPGNELFGTELPILLNMKIDIGYKFK